MTRVSNFNQSQFLLRELMRAQSDQAKTETEIASGKKVHSFKDLPGETSVLMGAHRVEANLEQYGSTATRLMSQIDFQDVQLNDFSTATMDARQQAMESLSVGSGLNFMGVMESLFDRAVAILNSQMDGKYSFAGTRTDTPPVTIESLDELVALPSVADAFQNNDIKRSMQIDENIVMEYGILADDIATDFFQALRDIKAYHDGPNGPFDSTLTPDQYSYLSGEVSRLADVAEKFTLVVAENGQRYNEVKAIAERHEKSSVYVRGFISDIEDADLSEAITRLNRDQIQTEATTRMLSSLHRMSLLDFI